MEKMQLFLYDILNILLLLVRTNDRDSPWLMDYPAGSSWVEAVGCGIGTAGWVYCYGSGKIVKIPTSNEVYLW